MWNGWPDIGRGDGSDNAWQAACRTGVDADEMCMGKFAAADSSI
jgi:hypothetical protein